jgi:hypothetical protein
MKANIKKQLKNLVILVFIATLLGCKKDNDMVEKFESFEWLAETGADETAPMEIVYGKFIMSDGSTGFVPSGQYLNTDWGSGDSGSMSVGEDRKKVPDSLKIVWFSYAENKFFEGHFQLPQKKMYDIFKKDYGTYKTPDGEDNKNAFNTLLLAIAPQGMITLFMEGVGGIEIGTYQAKETFDIDWDSFSKNPNRYQVIKNRQKEMPAFVQEEILKGKISNQYFKNRQKRYHYTIGTNKKDFTIIDYNVDFINNEVISKTTTGLEFLTDTANGKAVPEVLFMLIKGPFYRNIEVRIWVDLLDGKTTTQNDEIQDPIEERAFNNQLMTRFKTFFEQNKDVQLYIKFDDKIVKSNIKNPVYCGKVCLKSTTAEMEIPNSRVEVYDEERL